MTIQEHLECVFDLNVKLVQNFDFSFYQNEVSMNFYMSVQDC